MGPEISSRAELIDALRLAAELEHGLMAQYLFAAYSLKRYDYEGLRPEQLERVRRWASLVTLVARQEMEHLGLALNLLSAVGGTPSFSRPNMPQAADYYGAAGIKLELTRCDEKTVQRFQRFEAPDEITHPEKKRPTGKAEAEPKPVDQKKALAWCGREGVGRAEVASALLQPAGDGRLRGAPHVDLYGVPYKSVQELYEKITRGFETLSLKLGEPNLFVGRPVNQIFGGPQSPQYGTMNDLNQYGLDIIAVTDLASARQATRMIVEQGEGVRVPPSYKPHTHFCIFTQIREEMKRHGLGQLAARPVVPNPMTLIQPDVHGAEEVSVITEPRTREVAQLFNQCYEVMLLLLLYLYSDQVKTKEQTDGLMDAAFFPFMTMFIRPLAEILTELPAYEDKPGNAGPGFELSGDVLLFPDLDETWTLFQERLDALSEGFGRVVAGGDAWLDLPGQRTEGSEHSQVWLRLDYLRLSMERLAADWESRWLNIGRTTEV
jgi:Ferritin-like